MITAKEVLIKMGIIESQESLLAKIEECILQAAEKGERQIKYLFTEKADKETRDAIKFTLEATGYNVKYGRHMTTAGCFFDYGSHYFDEKEFIISW